MKARGLGREQTEATVAFQHGLIRSENSGDFEAQITTGLSHLRFRFLDGQCSHIADKILQRPRIHYQRLHPKGQAAFVLRNLSHIAHMGFRRQMEKQRLRSLSLPACVCAGGTSCLGIP